MTTSRPTADFLIEEYPMLDRYFSDLTILFQSLLGDDTVPVAPLEFFVEGKEKAIRGTFNAVDQEGVTEYAIYRSSNKSFNLNGGTSLISTVSQPPNPATDKVTFSDPEGTDADYYFVRAIKGNQSPKLKGKLGSGVNTFSKRSVTSSISPGKVTGVGVTLTKDVDFQNVARALMTFSFTAPNPVGSFKFTEIWLFDYQTGRNPVLAFSSPTSPFTGILNATEETIAVLFVAANQQTRRDVILSSGTYKGTNGITTILNDPNGKFVEKKITTSDLVANTSNGALFSISSIDSQTKLTVAYIANTPRVGSEGDLDDGDTYVILQGPYKTIKLAIPETGKPGAPAAFVLTQPSGGEGNGVEFSTTLPITGSQNIIYLQIMLIDATSLTTNGTFATDTDWTKGAGWTIASNKATGATASSDLEQNQTVVNGETYRVTYTVTGYSAGTVTVKVGGTSGTARSSDATFTEDILCGAGADPKLEFTGSGFTGSVSAVSVRHIWTDDIRDTTGLGVIQANAADGTVTNGGTTLVTASTLNTGWAGKVIYTHQGINVATGEVDFATARPITSAADNGDGTWTVTVASEYPFLLRDKGSTTSLNWIIADDWANLAVPAYLSGLITHPINLIVGNVFTQAPIRNTLRTADTVYARCRFANVNGSGPWMYWDGSVGDTVKANAVTFVPDTQDPDTITGGVAGITGTAGSVIFLTGTTTLDEDNANFFWDDTNNRLGIGTNTPASKLDILGTGADAKATITSDNAAGPSVVLSGTDASVHTWSIVSGGSLNTTANALIFADVTSGATIVVMHAGKLECKNVLELATGFGNVATVGEIRMINNGNGLVHRNAANSADVRAIVVNAADQVALANMGGDILWGTALVALGGGAAPTLGTIGGTGPATAGQNTWMRVIDSGGTAFWVPAWK